MEIRKAIREDAGTISKFQVHMALETENISLDADIVSRGVESVFQDPAKGFYILMVDSGQATACMLLTPEWSDWRNCTFLWIQSLYVLPAHRKQGAFRKMYDYVKEMVRDSDKYAGIKLYVAEENVAAQEVYSRVGMEASHYRLFEWNKMNV